MATYHVETENGTYEVETDEPQATNPLVQKLKDAVPYIAQASGPLTGGLIPSAVGQVLVNPQQRQAVENASSVPMRGLRGLGMLATNSGLDRANAATQADFKPQGIKENVVDLAANIADPRNMVANAALGEILPTAAKVGSKAASFLGDEAAKAEGALSGVSKNNIKQFFNHPIETLQADSSKVTGPLFQKAKELAGVTNREDRLITRAATSPESIAERMIGKVEQGRDLTVGEILAGKKATSNLANKNKGVYGPWFDKFNEMLAKQAPDVASAQADVAKSKTKEAFTRLVPYNKNGTPAVVRMLSGLGLMGAGAYHGNPAVGLAGAALMSPAAVGAGTLAAVGATKAAKGLNVLGQNPGVRQALLGLLTKLKNNPSQ